MILVTVRMKVLAEKRKELSQTIVSLIDSKRTEKGCLRCDFCRSMENELRILEEWDTRGTLEFQDVVNCHQAPPRKGS
jgi:quinol monooxygenase YgiN